MSVFFPPLQIDILKKDVLHLLGYRKLSSKVPERLNSTVDRELAIGRELLRFKGVYLKLQAEIESDRVILENGFTIVSSKFASWIEGCEYVYLFAVTAGSLCGERVAQLLNQAQTSLAMAADAVGSAAAEASASAANRYIASLEKGNNLTKRYSPGYGDWNVANNRDLILLLEAEKIGLTVNAGGLMLPEKSVSAAIGVKFEG